MTPHAGRTQLPRIVIIGRPNVGKSTLFNRICQQRRALVGNEPGMTRDRLYAPAEWRGRRFEVVDTGGMIPAETELIPAEIVRQARTAIDEATHLVLVVDSRAGVVSLDEELAALLRRTGKPITVAVNKVDAEQHSALAAEFHRLGLPDIVPISAEHGRGVDDLLDRVTARIEAETPSINPEDSGGLSRRRLARDRRVERDRVAVAKEEAGRMLALPGNSSTEEAAGKMSAPTGEPIKVAIIGRPNVGKSTLLNRLLKQERSIVTPLAGTTRDAVDAEIVRDGRRFLLIDTAGIRAKGKTKLLAEKLSVIQARKHLERSDVALLMLDAVDGVTALDTHIGGYAHESRRSVIIVVNKWDAIPRTHSTIEQYTQEIRDRMKYLDYAPILFISAERGQRVEKLVSTVAEVAEARRFRVPTAEMNRFVKDLDLGRVPVPAHRPLRVYYLTQGGVAPPTFIAFTNRGGKLHFSVERYLENRIRERFGFVGSPLIIKARESK